MSGEYAKGTDVSVGRSREELERVLNRFGASAFGYMTTVDGSVVITFEIQNVRVLMRMQEPQMEDFALSPTGRARRGASQQKDWEQERRRVWRTLVNGVKAKLSLVEDGISTVEREFLSDIVVPGTGKTYGELAIPQLRNVYENNALPPLVGRVE